MPVVFPIWSLRVGTSHEAKPEPEPLSDVLPFNPVTLNESDQFDLTCLPAFLFPPCSTHVKASITSHVAVWPVSTRRDWVDSGKS